MQKLKAKNVNGYIFQVLDPMEVNFQIAQYSALHDLEDHSKLMIDDSKVFQTKYKKEFYFFLKNY